MTVQDDHYVTLRECQEALPTNDLERYYPLEHLERTLLRQWSVPMLGTFALSSTLQPLQLWHPEWTDDKAEIPVIVLDQNTFTREASDEAAWYFGVADDRNAYEALGDDYLLACASNRSRIMHFVVDYIRQLLTDSW